SPPFSSELAALLWFGKGLEFYAPGLILPIRRALGVYRLWLGFLAGLILVYARWWEWWGGSLRARRLARARSRADAATHARALRNADALAMDRDRRRRIRFLRTGRAPRSQFRVLCFCCAELIALCP